MPSITLAEAAYPPRPITELSQGIHGHFQYLPISGPAVVQDGPDDVVIESEAEMGQPSLADVIEQDLSPEDEETLSKVQVSTPPPNTTKHVVKETASAKPANKQPGKKTLDELIEQT